MRGHLTTVIAFYKQSKEHKLKRPIRFIGVGEQADDLRDFSARDFVDALLDDG